MTCKSHPPPILSPLYFFLLNFYLQIDNLTEQVRCLESKNDRLDSDLRNRDTKIKKLETDVEYLEPKNKSLEEKVRILGKSCK